MPPFLRPSKSQSNQRPSQKDRAGDASDGDVTITCFYGRPGIYIYIKKQNKTQGHTGQNKIPVQNVCWKALSLGDKSNPGEERSA